MFLTKNSLLKLYVDQNPVHLDLNQDHVKQYRENSVSFLWEYRRNWVVTITYQTSSNLARLSTRLTSEIYLFVQSTQMEDDRDPSVGS